jgi:hypothetical protein
MVVYEDERARVDAKRGAERVGRTDRGPMKPTPRDTACRAQVAAAIEPEHPELFVCVRQKARHRPGRDIGRGRQPLRHCCSRDLDAAPELERGRDSASRLHRRVRALPWAASLADGRTEMGSDLECVCTRQDLEPTDPFEKVTPCMCMTHDEVEEIRNGSSFHLRGVDHACRIRNGRADSVRHDLGAFGAMT